MSSTEGNPAWPPDARVLLLQPAFLGDAVLSTAILESWHREFPGHRLSILVRKGAHRLFEGHPFIEQLFIWDRSGWAKYQRLAAMAKFVRSRHFDGIINLHRYGSMALLARAARPKWATGFSEGSRLQAGHTRQVVHSWGDGRHETERNHSQIAPWVGAWNAEVDRPRLHPAARDFDDASQWPQGALLLAPASVWATKRWPAERWSSLADAWAERHPDQDIMLIGGPEDGALLGRIAGECQLAKPKMCAGNLDLLGTAALMSQSSLVVSNDSAPLHMAGAMDVPHVAVFCSTTADFGFGVVPIMEKNGRALNVEIPPDALQCKPCGPHGHKRCPLGHFRCGLDLGIEQVLEAMETVSSPPSGSRTL